MRHKRTDNIALAGVLDGVVYETSLFLGDGVVDGQGCHLKVGLRSKDGCNRACQGIVDIGTLNARIVDIGTGDKVDIAGEPVRHYKRKCDGFNTVGNSLC